MRVRPGGIYIYHPAAWDVFDARTPLKDGDVVEVRNLSGCPPANTMGHAHVYKDGEFAGLVSTASLHPRSKG